MRNCEWVCSVAVALVCCCFGKYILGALAVATDMAPPICVTARSGVLRGTVLSIANTSTEKGIRVRVRKTSQIRRM